MLVLGFYLVSSPLKLVFVVCFLSCEHHYRDMLQKINYRTESRLDWKENLEVRLYLAGLLIIE